MNIKKPFRTVISGVSASLVTLLGDSPTFVNYLKPSETNKSSPYAFSEIFVGLMAFLM